jgi:hypothetical protein
MTHRSEGTFGQTFPTVALDAPQLDEHSLVSCAGLVPVLQLAEQTRPKPLLGRVEPELDAQQLELWTFQVAARHAASPVGSAEYGSEHQLAGRILGPRRGAEHPDQAMRKSTDASTGSGFLNNAGKQPRKILMLNCSARL